MNPRLVAIAGPLEGTVFPLTDEETSIGREASNRIGIHDLSVSRRHLVIKKQGGQLVLRDLDSFNGTFVNGIPVKERALEHGDRVKIGRAVFLFLLEESGVSAAPGAVELDESRWVIGSTVRLRREESRYLRTQAALEALPPAARLARDLKTLLSISTMIKANQGVKALQQQLLELITEVVPAQRGAILLVGRDLEEMESVFGWDRWRHSLSG